MKYEFHDPKMGALFGYSNHLKADRAGFSIQKNLIQFVWNRGDEPIRIEIDDIELFLKPNQLITITYFHQLKLPDHPHLTALLFNREFYCIADHDQEIGCNGILFFGTQDIPVISLEADNERKLSLLLQVILDEFMTHDEVQGEMLQMLLKRFIIICTRLAKEQLSLKHFDDSQIDTIRKFNFLVDIHFREKRKVKEYADLLHKSPKTLSNLFAQYNQKSPQVIIQERIILEAKRLLKFTDKQSQEIAYDLGFEDPAYFSRFFKKIAKVTPLAYKESFTFTED